MEGEPKQERTKFFVEFLRDEIDARPENLRNEDKETFEAQTEAARSLLELLPGQYSMEVSEGLFSQIFETMGDGIRHGKSPREVAMDAATFLMLRNLSERE